MIASQILLPDYFKNISYINTQNSQYYFMSKSGLGTISRLLQDSLTSTSRLLKDYFKTTS